MSKDKPKAPQLRKDDLKSSKGRKKKRRTSRGHRSSRRTSTKHKERKRREDRKDKPSIVEANDHDFESGVLYVDVVRGENICVDMKGLGLKGFCLWLGKFVILTTSFGKQRFKTKTRKKTDDPVWNQSFKLFFFVGFFLIVFSLTRDLNGLLKLDVFGTVRSKHSHKGKAVLDLSEIETDNFQDIWFFNIICNNEGFLFVPS